MTPEEAIKILTRIMNNNFYGGEVQMACKIGIEALSPPLLSNLDEAAKKYRDFREECGIKDPVMLNEIEEAYYAGAERMAEQEQPKKSQKSCNDCIHCVDRKDQFGWHFKGCFGGPYKGKFIAEIDECPLKHEQPEIDGDDGKFVKILIRKEFAEQFQRLGDELHAGQSSFIAAINPQEQPSLPSNLDGAAEEYAYNDWESDDYHKGASEGLPFDAIGHDEKCFKAGAEWMAQQGVTVKGLLYGGNLGIPDIPNRPAILSYCSASIALRKSASIA